MRMPFAPRPRATPFNGLIDGAPPARLPGGSLRQLRRSWMVRGRWRWSARGDPEARGTRQDRRPGTAPWDGARPWGGSDDVGLFGGRTG